MTRIPSSLVAVFVSMSLARTAAAQLPRGRADAVGMSAERLARIPLMLRDAVQRRAVAGVVTLIARDGKLVALDSAGWRDVAARSAIGRNTIFRIASMTKPVTSVAVMMLVEEGKVQLSDKLSKFVPEFAQTKVWTGSGDSVVPMEREITIHDLLTHRSGLTYGFREDTTFVYARYREAGINDGLNGRGGTQAENVARLAAQPLLFQPGRRWNYGLSVDVLGRVVEVASGLPLDEFFRTRIFAPLRMTSTAFRVPDDRLDRLAVTYMASGDSLIEMADTARMSPQFAVGRFGGRSAHGATTFFAGGAGLFSTVGDYARFAQMLANGGELDGVRLLSPKTVELMRSDATPDLAEPLGVPGGGFGLGFSVIRDIGAVGRIGSNGSFGWDGLLGTYFWVDPKERLVGVLMIQLFPQRPDEELARRFRTMTYAAIVR